MAVGRRKSREPRPNQFNVTLGTEDAALLRARAAELDLYPTTLAKQLLEKALAEREASRVASRPAPEPGGTPGEEVLEILEKLRTELLLLRKAHYNATKELLSRSGPTVRKARTRMSVREIEEWAEKHLLMKPS